MDVGKFLASSSVNFLLASSIFISHCYVIARVRVALYFLACSLNIDYCWVSLLVPKHFSYTSSLIFYFILHIL